MIVRLGERELEKCQRFAAQWTHPGRSNVRSQSERADTLQDDQLTALVANLAGAIWLYGRVLGHYAFDLGRFAASRAPLADDGGQDIPLRNIDFKGQYMRSTLPMEKYRLPVRPKERREGWVFVHVLIEQDYRVAHLRGWAADEEFPPEPDADGPVQGAYTIPYERLHRIPPFTSLESAA